MRFCAIVRGEEYESGDVTVEKNRGEMGEGRRNIPEAGDFIAI